jgi:hypothetical protein
MGQTGASRHQDGDAGLTIRTLGALLFIRTLTVRGVELAARGLGSTLVSLGCEAVR